MQATVDTRPRPSLLARARPWVALIVAAIIFALIPLIGVPLFYALPLIGFALIAGTPPDYATDAKPVARRPRNVVLGVVILICVSLVVLQPHLTLALVELVGLDMAGLVMTVVAVVALALPLAMADSATPITDLPQSRLVLTRWRISVPAASWLRSVITSSSASCLPRWGTLAIPPSRICTSKPKPWAQVLGISPPLTLRL